MTYSAKGFKIGNTSILIFLVTTSIFFVLYVGTQHIGYSQKDPATGKTNWEHPTEFPTWVSPVVSNGLVFSGHITDTGKPYTVNVFGAPISTPLSPSGIIMALDESTGDKLWEFNVGAPVGIGGPSIGHGMLLVPTSVTAEIHTHKAGTIFAFGLPE